MLLKTSGDFNISLKESFMIGDSLTDITAGKKAGCKTVLIKNQDSRTEESSDYTTHNLYEFAKFLENFYGKN
jgi:D-glycero-D-manno-heptose 1,7-bisphosphate phosphatase